MDTNRRKQLEDLAAEVLNETGQQDVQDRLDDDDEESAVEYLLGAIDACYRDGMEEERAAEHYKVLGADPERASSLRQSSGKL